MKALVAEHPHVVGFIVQGLREAGYVVDVASDAEEALQLGRSRDHDVIVLAFALPKQGGVQVAAALRRSGVSTPILMLIPRDDDAERTAREAGANGHLVKPFRFEVLLDRLQALVTRGHRASS
ncbi:MAG TPA: response regulator [bacterium]|nr:response regulator [bacterium]